MSHAHVPEEMVADIVGSAPMLVNVLSLITEDTRASRAEILTVFFMAFGDDDEYTILLDEDEADFFDRVYECLECEDRFIKVAFAAIRRYRTERRE